MTKPANAPSTNKNPSGKGRGNNPPRSNKGGGRGNNPPGNSKGGKGK